MKLKAKRFLQPVTDAGRYTILEVASKSELKYCPLLLTITKDDTGVAHGLLIPTWNNVEASLKTNLGRLVLTFGDETDNWSKKKIDIKIDDQGRKLVYPVQ